MDPPQRNQLGSEKWTMDMTRSRLMEIPSIFLIFRMISDLSKKDPPLTCVDVTHSRLHDPLLRGLT